VSGAAEADGVLAQVVEVVYLGAYAGVSMTLGDGSRVTAHVHPGRVRPGDPVRVRVRGPAVCVP
jgi:hypothetical protein